MDANKRLEIKNKILELYDSMDKTSIVHKLEQEYIFGPLGENEHYNLSEYISIYDEIYLEKNPLPVVEEPEVVEELIEE
jgi:hypothetical protein